MPPQKPDTTTKSILVGLLSWIIPGAGHFVLGHRGLGIVCFIAVTFPYLTGLAFGGIMPSVNVVTNRWLFLAELCVGGYTLPSLAVSRTIEGRVLGEVGLSRVPNQQSPDDHERKQYESYLRTATRMGYMSYFPESDVAQIYLATAGLLNILVILDAISRAQTGGLPTFQREMTPTPEAEPGP